VTGCGFRFCRHAGPVITVGRALGEDAAGAPHAPRTRRSRTKPASAAATRAARCTSRPTRPAAVRDASPQCTPVRTLTRSPGGHGGYGITRAVRFEHRLVATIADPGVVDVSAGWTAHLPPALLGLPDSGQKDAFNAAMAQAQASANPAAARTLAFRSKPCRSSRRPVTRA